jgi:hypothetical protein
MGDFIECGMSFHSIFLRETARISGYLSILTKCMRGAISLQILCNHSSIGGAMVPTSTRSSLILGTMGISSRLIAGRTGARKDNGQAYTLMRSRSSMGHVTSLSFSIGRIYLIGYCRRDIAIMEAGRARHRPLNGAYLNRTQLRSQRSGNKELFSRCSRTPQRSAVCRREGAKRKEWRELSGEQYCA